MTETKTRQVYRDAKTGKFISAKRAKKLSKKRTVLETITYTITNKAPATA